MKHIFSLLTLCFLLFSSISCSKDNGIDEPGKGPTPTESIDEKQMEQTAIVIAAANSKAMVETIEQSGSNYVITFSDGKKAEITLKSSGSANAVYVKSISTSETDVTFTLTNGTVLTIPQLYAISVTFDSQDFSVMGPNETRYIHYSVTSNYDDVKVQVEPSSGLSAEVVPDSNPLQGTIAVTTGQTIPNGSTVTIFISNPGKTISRQIAIEPAGLEVYNNTLKKVSNSGGNLKLEFLSNVDCTLSIPEDHQSWISSTKTRALEYAFIEVEVAPNSGYDREGKVVVKNEAYGLNLEYTISQKGDLGEYVEHPDLTGLTVPEDEIWYITNNNKPISFSKVNNPFDAIIISNTYADGYGIVKFTNKVTEIKNHAFSDTPITEIYMPECIEIIGDFAFSSTNLKTVRLPRSLTNMHPYAFSSTKMTSFSGNENFISSDRLCLYTTVAYEKIICQFANGSGITDYVVEDGFMGIENYAFKDNKDIQTVTFPEKAYYFPVTAFEGCDNLEAIYGPQTYENRFVVNGSELSSLIIRKNFPAKYRIPDEFTSIGYQCFTGCLELEEVTMGDQITILGGYAFEGCVNLKSLTLSANLEQIGRDGRGYNPFHGCSNLREVYFRAQIPPAYSDQSTIRYPYLKLYVPRNSVDLYKNYSGWSTFGNYIEPYDYTDLPPIDKYFSTDYSQDGKVVTLQKASEGNGINIVLMGDGYSDRMIANGEYEKDMQYLYGNLFNIEPYSSFKDLFNVYYVNAVSLTEGNGNGPTAFSTNFGDMTFVFGNDQTVLKYTLNALNEIEMNEALMIVAINSDRYAGTNFSYYPDNNVVSDYGSGPAIAYFPKGEDDFAFTTTLHHEANGHGFAKLADEYYYDYLGTLPSDQISGTIQQQNQWGWWKNVDFTDDPAKVRWSHFISDNRYADEGIGVFQGGMVYPFGVWRPSVTSIMVNNVGEFNAPSREAIYYRIHKLAYGDSWNYDYEEFVKYDLNRTRSNSTRSSLIGKPKLHEPVVVKKSWKDVLKGK